MDDILSGLDAPVAQHIVSNCIMGMLKRKTRIVVTEHETLHMYATQIIYVQDGVVRVVDSNDSHDNIRWPEGSPAALASTDFDLQEGIVELTNSVDSLLVEEQKEQGYLSAEVFKTYWRACGGWIGFMVLLSVVLMQVSKNLSDVWLSYWVSQNATVAATNTDLYLGVYAGLATVNSIVTLVRSFLFAYAGIRAAKCIHNRMLNNVMYARFQFFDITPLGRILNRFSSDTYTIDDSLPFILNILIAQLAGLIGKLLRFMSQFFSDLISALDRCLDDKRNSHALAYSTRRSSRPCIP